MGEFLQNGNYHMQNDDILLYKPISHPEDYCGLQADIDAIYRIVLAPIT